MRLAVRELVCFVWWSVVGAMGVVFIIGPLYPAALKRERLLRVAIDNGRRVRFGVAAGAASVRKGTGSSFMA